jgi:hypothetical protein
VVHFCVEYLQYSPRKQLWRVQRAVSEEKTVTANPAVHWVQFVVEEHKAQPYEQVTHWLFESVYPSAHFVQMRESVGGFLQELQFGMRLVQSVQA